MQSINKRRLYQWCSIPCNKLNRHSPKMPYEIVLDSKALGKRMAGDLIEEIKRHNKKGEPTRAIIPCGPSCWYEPFARMVNAGKISLKNLFVFHMDECLDWQGRLLPAGHPYNFRATMEKVFYNPIQPALSVPEEQRFWLTPATMGQVRREIAMAPIDITLGGWGQDGHVAYNQTRREPYCNLSVEELAAASIRIQNNNWDTVIALAQRALGTAYQFSPPMSITLGIKECLGAKKVRLYSDTGAWKQTAFRVALFGPVTAEYPLTLLQKHPDAKITATRDTAAHAISLHPEWDFFGDRD